jgi:hypothetical protein
MRRHLRHPVQQPASYPHLTASTGHKFKDARPARCPARPARDSTGTRTNEKLTDPINSALDPGTT